VTDRREVPPGASADLVAALVPELAGVAVPAAEAPITVDQTNTSVAVADRAIVKWLYPPVPEPHRGVDLLRQLAAAGFERTPRLLGVHVVDGMVDAVVTEYLPRARDGWDWYIAEAEAWARGDDALDPLIGRAVAFGELAAEMHTALATPTVVMPEPVGRASIEPARARGLALLDEALAVTGGPAGEQLRGMASRIRDEIESFGGADEVVVQPVHGDFHAGQLLLAGDRLDVIDLDGDPVAAPADRHARQPAVRDVASMVQAIDHVGRVADKRLDYRRSDPVDAFIAASIEAAMAAYRARLVALASPVVVDDRLLRPMRIVQELHELVYAARHLPVWLYVPEAALPALFDLPFVSAVAGAGTAGAGSGADGTGSGSDEAGAGAGGAGSGTRESGSSPAGTGGSDPTTDTDDDREVT
jgi:maltokinase